MAPGPPHAAHETAKDGHAHAAEHPPHHEPPHHPPEQHERAAAHHAHADGDEGGAHTLRPEEALPEAPPDAPEEVERPADHHGDDAHEAATASSVFSGGAHEDGGPAAHHRSETSHHSPKVKVAGSTAGSVRNQTILRKDMSEAQDLRHILKQEAGSICSPDAFAAVLRLRRGSVLRAWRLDLDRRGSGRVAFSEFTLGCRRLGIPTQAKRIWTALHPGKDGESTQLELHEVEEAEAANLEHFAAMLRDSPSGFVLGAAWRLMDPKNRGVVNASEFATFAESIGFSGDAGLLFRGLDSTGLGRMNFSDFQYLAAVSRATPERRLPPNCAKAVGELIVWVQEELGGADAFLTRLGLQGSAVITVPALAAQLAVLGFPGDAREAATKAARSGDGTRIGAEALRSLLSPESRRLTVAANARRFRSTPSRPRVGLVGRPAWNDRCPNFSLWNEDRFWKERSCFCCFLKDTGPCLRMTAPDQVNTPLRKQSSMRRPSGTSTNRTGTDAKQDAMHHQEASSPGTGDEEWDPSSEADARHSAFDPPPRRPSGAS